MSPTAALSHELHLWLSTDLVERSLPARWEAAGAVLELFGNWTDTPWIGPVPARRRPGRWTAGSALGEAWVEVAPAGRGRSLLVVAVAAADVRRPLWRPAVTGARAAAEGALSIDTLVALAEQGRRLAVGDPSPSAILPPPWLRTTEHLSEPVGAPAATTQREAGRRAAAGSAEVVTP